MADIRTLIQHLAARWLQKPYDGPGRGGFAAARFPHQAEHFSFFHLEAHLVDRMDHLVLLHDPALFQAQRLEKALGQMKFLA